MSNYNPKLITGNDALTAAENILIELKHYFTSTKFTIDTLDNRGEKIRIDWDGKLTCAEVSKIVAKYSLLVADKENYPYTKLREDRSFNKMHGGVTLICY